jgi:Domain of unknown function (DUF4333)
MVVPPSRRLRRGLRRAALAFALSAALALAGCGSSGSTASLNEKKIERAIERSSLAQRGLVAEVNCPADIGIEKGVSFECVAVVAKTRTRFVVTQTDAAGHVRYEAP